MLCAAQAERLLDALTDAGAQSELFVLPPDALEEAPPELLELAANADVWIPRQIPASSRGRGRPHRVHVA
jgi:hypothetical protein